LNKAFEIGVEKEDKYLIFMMLTPRHDWFNGARPQSFAHVTSFLSKYEQRYADSKASSAYYSPTTSSTSTSSAANTAAGAQHAAEA
jgi:hypothetical protein